MKPVLLSLFLIAALAAPAFAQEEKKPEVPAAAPVVDAPAAPAVPAVETPAPAAPVAEKPAEKAPEKPADKAAEKTAPDAPDISNMLFIQNLRKAGATVYYLGESLGMHGWFAIKDQQVQIFYTTPGNKALIVGALLSPEGGNISQQQMAIFAQNHPEAMGAMQSAAGTPPEGSSPAEQLFANLATAAQVSFGKQEAPFVYMVMDVNCSHCHKTWKALETPVNEGKLRVVMVPIPALGAQSATQAATWLGAANPQESWKKYMGGDAKALDGTPSQANLALIGSNLELAARAKISQTPTILYRGKNGKLRLVVGEPKDINLILNDIGGK